MRAAPLIVSCALAMMAVAPTTYADSHAVAYSAAELLSPCQEADNDARWGEAAETECEQYILGFVAALNVSGAGANMGICPPAQNTADEVRWAFMRWVHQKYGERTKMSAEDAMADMLKENFACE